MKRELFGTYKIELNDDNSGRITIFSYPHEQIYDFAPDQKLSPRELKRLWQNLLDRASSVEP